MTVLRVETARFHLGQTPKALELQTFARLEDHLEVGHQPSIRDPLQILGTQCLQQGCHPARDFSQRLRRFTNEHSINAKTEARSEP